MGLFDSLKNMFAHHEHHHGASIGQPLTLTDTKAVLAFIVMHQHLADMRKVAEAVKQLQDEMPQYITFGMSHYYSEPKRVRFQSEGGQVHRCGRHRHRICRDHRIAGRVRNPASYGRYRRQP